MDGFSDLLRLRAAALTQAPLGAPRTTLCLLVNPKDSTRVPETRAASKGAASAEMVRVACLYALIILGAAAAKPRVAVVTSGSLRTFLNCNASFFRRVVQPNPSFAFDFYYFAVADGSDAAAARALGPHVVAGELCRRRSVGRLGRRMRVRARRGPPAVRCVPCRRRR